MKKLTLNYSESKKDIDTSLFTLKRNNLIFESTNCIGYLGVQLDNKLSWN